ncbi:MAG TPA: beta-L-arabinofuranosidase domain-containing protein, partial [Fimbriimonas sp.]|nr:beta-L-arabinofuranosidase domain-containing protein [Fimbriimonas sp.]
TELALIKLWKATNNKRYFDLAEFFIQSRGSKFFATEHNTPLSEYDGRYWSDHKPIREMESIEGHAVRAAYLFTGVTDYLRFKPDPALQSAIDKVWRSNTERRMFVTGGLGPSGSNEGFTVDYDLPTFTAYQESCASIANAIWNHRLALLEGDSKYSDIMETAIYNGAMAGISADGDEYFYVNPLASAGGHHRRPWYECACCPPNLARMIGQIGGMAYATSNDALYVNLFVAGSMRAKVAGKEIGFNVTTEYPYDGRVKFQYTGKAAATFKLKVRKPSWAITRGDDQDGYLTIDQTWSPGDTTTMNFEMPVRRVISNPNVKDTFGMVALARGPLVYCLESVDNPFSFSNIGVPLDQQLFVRKDKSVFGGIPVIEGTAYEYGEQNWKNTLFATAAAPASKRFKAIPYFLWDNRPKAGKTNEMIVWLSPNPKPAALRGLEPKAKVSVSFHSNISGLDGINDGYVPEGSNPNSPQQLHFWPHKGGTEWVQYTFATPVTLSGSRIYWFDDTGRGECKVPSGFKMQAKVDGAWKDVDLKSGSFGLALDKWNEFQFKPVKSSEFRLLLTQKVGFASGIHEWQVFEE